MSLTVIFFGSGKFGLPSLERLAADKRFTIAAIVTQPAKPQTPSGELITTPVGHWATGHHLALLTPATLKTPDMQQTVAVYQADVFVIIDYGLILPSAILALARLGGINVHASLLPRWRGASPITAAITTGDQETGVTIIQIDSGVDTGPVLKQAKEPIQPDDTTPKLYERLATLGASMLPDTLTAYATKALTPQAQSTAGVTLAKKLAKDDGQATWDSAVVWERKVRAYTPWPGVWTTWKNWQIKITAAHVRPGTVDVPVGTVEQFTDGSWGIACGDGWLVPAEVQFSGKQPQPAMNIPGSYPGFIGSRLG